MYWKISKRISLWYFCFGFLWIALSDWVLVSIIMDPGILSIFQMLKGWFFVAVTAILLFFFTHKQVQKEIERADKYKENENRFKSFFDNVYQITAITDKKGHTLYTNKAGLAFFQGLEAEVRGRGLWEFSVWDTDSRAKKELMKAIPVAAAGELVRFEAALKHDERDERYLDFSVKPAFDEDGKVIALIAEGRDISELKRFANRLEKYEHMVSSSRDIMCLVDKEYIYQEVNAKFAEVSNRSRAEIVGKTVAEVVGRTEFENKIKPFVDQCLKGLEVNLQDWMVTPNGEKSRLDISYFPHYEKNGNGKIDSYVVIARDITKTQQLEDKLRQAYKIEAIGTLAGGIAHDFNNILGAIMGYTEETMDLVERGSQAWKYLERIHSAGHRASGLIRQILSFSRQADQEILPVQMGPIIKEALKLIRASLPTSIEINYNIRSEAIVESDPTQLHQIIMNLCANAGYAMKEAGGVLTVSLHDMKLDRGDVPRYEGLSPGRYVKLTVADTGCGMTPEVKRRSFDPFYTTKPKGVGTGMGLSQVHGIVEGCRGNIMVFSDPGQGTTFHVYLPAVESDGREVAQTVEQVLPGGSESILFVDDEAFLVELGKGMLEKLGYRVEAISSSVEALKIFKKNPGRFDLVITDYAMPNMTGDKLSEEILQKRPGVPIIMITGFGDRFTEDAVKALGIRKLILKPILRKDIAFAIREVLEESGDD